MPPARSRLLSAGLAVAALAAPATAGATPDVHVRVEGAKRTVLPDTTVTTNPKRAIGLGSEPTCSGGSGLGALDAATRGRWGGSYFDSLGYSVETVLGETHSFAANDTYYNVYVNDRSSSLGLCSITPKRGDHIMLGVAGKTTPEVIRLAAPKKAAAGRAFTVNVTAVAEKGKPSPLAGARVAAGRLRATTGANGQARLVPAKRGTLALKASKNGFIRSEAAKVRVAKEKKR